MLAGHTTRHLVAAIAMYAARVLAGLTDDEADQPSGGSDGPGSSGSGNASRAAGNR